MSENTKAAKAVEKVDADYSLEAEIGRASCRERVCKQV